MKNATTKKTEDFDRAFDEGVDLDELFDFSKAESKPGIPADKIRDLTKEAEDAKRIDPKKYPKVASVVGSKKI